MTTVSLEQASRDFKETFSKAQEGEVKIIAPDNRVGILLSYDKFRAMQIKCDLAQDPRDLVKIIDDGDRFEEGDMDGFENVSVLIGKYHF